jgi:hypothetical protein
VCELVLDYYMGLGVIKLSRRKKKEQQHSRFTLHFINNSTHLSHLSSKNIYFFILKCLVGYISVYSLISCLTIISTHGGNYQEERKSMIELVLVYYLVLGVIKLCLWGKRGVKIYLVVNVKGKEIKILKCN